MKDDEDYFRTREERSRALLRKQADRAIDLRNRDREFHGMEREFHYHQMQMTVDFKKTKDVKHPRDVGSAREQILWKFLSSSGYLPKRYGLSNRSIRVASTTGHLSNEIDIAIYDPLDSISLMDREDVYQVLPIESVFGVIQVKSRLNKTEIQEGLANLASFKALNRPPTLTPTFRTTFGGETPKADRGFGILFAFDSDLPWQNILSEINRFAECHPSQQWANAVFILEKGFFLHGSEAGGAISNAKIDEIQTLQMHGYPNRDGLCLYQFQSILLDLLRNTQTHPAQMDAYFSLPLVVGAHSYSFTLGQFAEVGICEKHGDFQRKITAEKLQMVTNWARLSQPINWVRAVHLAYDLPEDDAAYKRQPGEVYIYNPESLPLPDILTMPSSWGDVNVRANAYDMIQTGGMHILIPYHYSITQEIVSTCPSCAAEAKPTGSGVTRRARRAKR